MHTNATDPSVLIQSVHKLNAAPAVAISDDTAVPRPRSQFVVDDCIANHITRTKDSFVFVPDLNSYQTYSILRSAKEAWQHDKLPVLAVCAFSKSPAPFQKETGIQADTADQFLSDLQFAHRMVPTVGAHPAYIIRHYHSPNDKYDDVILPAHANLIVYEPHALSPTQLTTLFEHVANVRGKIILCDDRQDFANSHPVLNEAVEKSISKAVPEKLRHLVESSHDEKRNTHVQTPTTVDNKSRPVHDSESAHAAATFSNGEPHARSPYLIYHAKTEHSPKFPSDYLLVAKVQSDDIYRTLADSHYSGASWTENPGVVTFTHNARSTRPGDIICHNGEVNRLSVDDVAKIKLMDSPLDRSQKENFAGDNPAPETPEPDRPRRKFKP